MASQPAGNSLIPSSSSHRLPTVSAAEALRRLREAGGRVIPTGIPELDARLTGHALSSYGRGGVVRGQLTEVFGPPGCGKTAFGVQVAVSALREGGAVVWIDVASDLPRPRLESAGSQLSSFEDRFHHYFAPSLAHLIVLVRHQTPKFPPPGTALIVVDDISHLFPLPFSRSSSKTSSIPRTPTSALQLTLLGDLNRIASSCNLAVVITSHVGTRVRHPNGALLVAAHGSKDWDDGFSSRLAIFRDFPPNMESKSSGAEDPNLARLRYAGIIKAYGVSKLENDSIIEIIPFTLSLSGALVTIQYRTKDAKRSISSPVKSTKRRREEVPDSDDDWDDELGSLNGYEWEDDEVEIIAERPKQNSQGETKRPKVDEPNSDLEVLDNTIKTAPS